MEEYLYHEVRSGNGRSNLVDVHREIRVVSDGGDVWSSRVVDGVSRGRDGWPVTLRCVDGRSVFVHVTDDVRSCRGCSYRCTHRVERKCTSGVVVPPECSCSSNKDSCLGERGERKPNP